MLAGDEPKQIGLVSLKQISDVLLVHDSRALLRPAEIRTVGLGYVKLVGTIVKTAEGKVIGKVMPLSSIRSYEMQPQARNCYIRAAPAMSSILFNCSARNLVRCHYPNNPPFVQDFKLALQSFEQSCTSVVQVRDFLFSPDDGRISQLIIDALGIPALPERLLGCLGVRIQLVNSISFNCISLQPGAEVYVNKISPGAFDGAVELLKVRHTSQHSSHSAACSAVIETCLLFSRWALHSKHPDALKSLSISCLLHMSSQCLTIGHY